MHHALCVRKEVRNDEEENVRLDVVVCVYSFNGQHDVGSGEGSYLADNHG